MLTYPLLLYRGDSWRVRFALWKDTAKTDPYDLTGKTATAEIRGAGDPGVTALACVIAANTIDVALDATASRTLPAVGDWDLQLVGGADVQTIVKGSVAVQGDITDSGA